MSICPSQHLKVDSGQTINNNKLIIQKLYWYHWKIRELKKLKKQQYIMLPLEHSILYTNINLPKYNYSDNIRMHILCLKSPMHTHILGAPLRSMHAICYPFLYKKYKIKSLTIILSMSQCRNHQGPSFEKILKSKTYSTHEKQWHQNF